MGIRERGFHGFKVLRVFLYPVLFGHCIFHGPQNDRERRSWKVDPMFHRRRLRRRMPHGGPRVLMPSLMPWTLRSSCSSLRPTWRMNPVPKRAWSCVAGVQEVGARLRAAGEHGGDRRGRRLAFLLRRAGYGAQHWGSRPSRRSPHGPWRADRHIRAYQMAFTLSAIFCM